MEAYSMPAGVEKQLTFTYKDNEGDEVRFDTNAELDLAIRNSSVPLRIMVANPPPSSSASSSSRSTPNPEATSAAPPSIPFTPGYAVASNVGSVVGGGDEADMIMVDMPGEAAAAAAGPSGGSVDGSQADGPEKEAINPQAAFEAEAAAARDPEGSLLYQKASMRLAKRFKVHLTPTQLWRVMALFQIQGRQLVVFGLSPHRSLDAAAAAASDLDSSDEEGGENKPSAVRGLKRSKSQVAQTIVADHVQRLLGLNGVELPEDEVQPLLQALRVRSRRLVRLGLLGPEFLEDMPDGHYHRDGKGPRGGPPGHPMHGHGHGPGGRFGGRGGGGRGGGPPSGRGGGAPPMPFHSPPPLHYQGGGFSGPHGGGGAEGAAHRSPPRRGPPPPHMMGMGMGGPPMEPSHGHHHQRGGGRHPPPPHMRG
ncbi:unnamed protein product, partial [Ectocarpus sp. 12 AP-2014]